MDLAQLLPDEIVSLVAKYDYVSLDIFDTLIVRCCHHPADIFEIAGKAYKPGHGLEDFKERRVRAESHARDMARKQGRKETTLDEIYAILAKETGLSDEVRDGLKHLEIETEIAFSSHSGFGRNLVKYLIQEKKRFILASDMYLPKTAVEALLEKSGFSGHEALLLSSETGRMKHFGEMFDDIAQHFGAAPEKILHVGDSFHSDYLRAIEKGFVAYHRPALRETFGHGELWDTTALFRGHSGFKYMVNALYLEEFSKGQKIVDYVRSDEDRYWHALGWLVVAPLMLGLSIWIDRTCRTEGIKKLAFLARDGQFAQRAFTQMGFDKEIRTSYVAASRRLYTVPNTVLAPQEIINFYSYLVDRSQTGEDLVNGIPGGAAIKDRLASLGLDLSQPIGKIKDALFLAIGENSGLLTQALGCERAVLGKYLDQEFSGKAKVALFDVGWRGSLQASIERIKPSLTPRMTGLYFGTVPEAVDILLKNGSQYRSFSMQNGLPEWMREGNQLNTDVIEFLFSADHGSVVGVELEDKTFIWKKAQPSESEKASQTVARKIQDGAIDAIDAVLATLPADELGNYYDNSQIMSDFYSFLNNPTAFDARMFSKVRVFSGIGDAVGEQLSGREAKSNLVRDFRKSRWKAGFMRSLGRRDRVVIRLLMKAYTGSELARKIWRAIR
jgi:predicted HAD superfamily hydrolase